MLGFSQVSLLLKDLAGCFSRMRKDLNLLVILPRRFWRWRRYANGTQRRKRAQQV